MTAREVYEAQGRLTDAEYRLSEVAADWHAMATQPGAFVGTEDYLRGPEAREVERLRDEVAAAQETVGGVVYRVPVENMAALRKKLDGLVKRAAKLGIAEMSYRVTDEVERHESKIDPLVAMAELGYVPRSTAYRFVVLNAGVLKLAGWMFLATLSVEPGGVMVSKVPGFARAWALHREGKAAQAPTNFGDEISRESDAALDAMDLSAYRDEATATRCEHCGLARRRTKTYLVEHVETGEVKQVGSNCLRDFLGVDPNSLVKHAEYLRDADAALSGEGGGSGGGRETDVETYLTHVSAMLRVHGWSPRSGYTAGLPTADAAWDNLWNYGKKDKGHPLYDEVTDADYERAVASLTWAREHFGAKLAAGERMSDFDHNLYVAANGDTVPKKGDGLLAYLPVAHAKFEEREIEQRERAKRQEAVASTSAHVGQPGDRVQVTARVMSVFEHEGNYGTTFITTLHDDAGNEFKWFGSYELERDSVVEATWTVKKHDEWKGTKQTVLTRPSKLTKVEQAVA